MTQQAEIIGHGGQLEYMDKDMFTKTQLEITPQQIMSVIVNFFFFKKRLFWSRMTFHPLEQNM